MLIEAKMTGKIILNILLLFIFITSFCFAQNFEGVVNFTMQNHSVGEVSEIVWSKKGDNHRLDINTTVGEHQYDYTLLFLENDPMLKMLSDAGGEKWVYETPISVLDGKDQSLAGAREVKDLPTFGKLARTCKSWILENAFLRSEFCLDEAGELALSDFPPLIRAANYFRFLEKRNIVATPMEIHTYDLEGLPLYSQTIESVQSKGISVSVFRIPDGYEVRK